MENNSVKTRNASIDLFRYICAVLVVAIHTRPFEEFSTFLGFFFSQVLTRVAVPFFFVVAGYFYIAKLEKGKTPFFKYIKRLLVTYLLWSMVYYAYDFFSEGVLSIKSFVYSFLINGSCYHLWFFPAIIFAVCLTTFLYKIKCKKVVVPLSLILYAVGCLGCSWYAVGVKIPVLSKLYNFFLFTDVRRIFLMGFPFFVAGGVVLKVKEKILPALNKKTSFLCIASAVVVFLAEIIAVIKFNLQNTVVITFGLYPLVVLIVLLLFKFPMPNFNKISDKTRVYANFTYYAHPLLMNLLRIMAKVLHFNISQTVMFASVLVITFVISTVIYKLNNKTINYFVN